MPVVQRAAPACLSDASLLGSRATAFPRALRLTAADDYRRVFRHCQYRLNNRWMTVLASPGPCTHPRLGLAISRKIAPTAVARNRIKRVIRESYRHWQTRLGAVDIVILGRAGIAAQSNKVLTTGLDTLWTELIETCAGSSSN